jgi:hypothetical protein
MCYTELAKCNIIKRKDRFYSSYLYSYCVVFAGVLLWEGSDIRHTYFDVRAVFPGKNRSHIEVCRRYYWAFLERAPGKTRSGYSDYSD